MSDGHLYQVALDGRPRNYRRLDPEAQWAIDRELGILDWSGDCPHAADMCPICRRTWEQKFGSPPADAGT